MVRDEQRHQRGLLKTLPAARSPDGATDWHAVFAAFCYRMACRHVPQFSSEFSPRRFTQPQLLTCVALKGRLGSSYRLLSDTLRGHTGVRAVLDLDDVPHYSTLQRFAERLSDRHLMQRVHRQATLCTIRYGQWLRHREGARAAHPDGPGADINVISRRENGLWQEAELIDILPGANREAF